MARNLLDLAQSLEAKAKAIDKTVSDMAVKVAMNLLNTLVYRTPVDTSAALSNWQVRLDSPAMNFIQPYVPGYNGYTQTASAAQTLLVGNAVLENKKPGQTIYISNSTPYIRKLNSGSSRQAPAGFVEASVLVARKTMPKFTFKV